MTDNMHGWQERTRTAEERAQEESRQDGWRLRHHLMPPVGWLNDPNGLCQKDGVYHIYFQYSPFDAEGGEKYWGHYESEDLVHWRYTGAFLAPDTEWDRSGVYSGCALVEDGKLYFYYTGNVKLEGKHDYIRSGREANTVLTVSEDGRTAGKKELLMTSRDYGSDMTLHVRDPKVWKENGLYYMVQGARDMEDKGCALVFVSEDGRNWSRKNVLRKESLDTYMWECPDIFLLEGKRIFSFSPQGMKAEEYRWQNQYQSGYCLLDGDFTAEDGYRLGDFREWDMGFDFYAPQTFEDEQGRRILVGWMGMIECDYDNMPTVKRGWQHCLTIPRELVWDEERRIVLQRPVQEMEALRGASEEYREEASLEWNRSEGLELHISSVSSGEGTGELHLEAGGLRLDYEKENGVLTLAFTDRSGSGRKQRKARIGALKNARIFLDASAAEIYINGGETVMSTRFYPKKDFLSLKITVENGTVLVYHLKNMEIDRI